MNKLTKNILIAFALTTGYLLLATVVFAQSASQMIQVSPAIIDISLSPGKTYQYEIKIANLSDIPLPVRLTPDNFDVNDEEGGYDFNAAPSKTSLSNWVTTDPKDVILPAQTQIKVKLTINLPKAIPIGGYYSMLFIEPVIPQTGVYQSLVLPKIGVLLLANIGAQSEGVKGEILSYNLNQMIYSKNDLLATDFRFKNLSLNFYSAKPFLTIKNIFGQAIKNELGEKIIFPGKIRHWRNNLELNNLSYGIYSANLAVSVGQGVQITKKSYFLLLPVKLLLILILLTTFLIFITVKRPRLIKFFRILIKGR
jgi:hypothetical protein